MSELILYTSDDGRTRLDLRVDGQTVWLTQLEIAELFQTTKQNVSLHAKNVFKDGELIEDSVVKDSLTTAADGKRYSAKRSADIPVREKEWGFSSPRRGGLENTPSCLEEDLEKIGV